MSAPVWMESLVKEFGKGAGLPDLALSDRGTAALAFENGASLCFEYAEGTLAVSMTVPSPIDPARAGALLSHSHPDARRGSFRIRTGYLANRGRAVFAVRLAEREATLPLLNQVFAALWEAAREYGGAAWH